MSDEQQMAVANERHARQLIEAAGYLSHDPLDQAAALLTAATSIIQRHMGPTTGAAEVLNTMLAPTIEHWSTVHLTRGERAH